jgi:hypothetical protein
LTSVSVEKNVKSIGISAFWGCFALEQINYGGTSKEWSAIEKGEYWNYNTGNYTVRCSDGTAKKR